MDSKRWQQVQDLCDSALQHTGNNRAVFLESSCGQDEALRGEIESLLAFEAKAEDFLETPAVPLLPEWLANFGRLNNLLNGVDLNGSETILSRYRIVEKLGSGGMGVVYKAEDTKLGRFVALKFLLSPLSATGDTSQGETPKLRAFERFQQEARTCSSLDHPGICTVYEVEQYAGLPFIVMQFLAGRTLKEEIAGQPLSTDKVLDLGIQIADALHAAHSAGIIHRDIKPANVFVNQRGEAKILDFGIAKLSTHWPVAACEAGEFCHSENGVGGSVRDSLTGAGALLGTASYMSPEQVRREELDARSDLFSFGAVLYEMATGRQAFPGKTNAQIFNAILYDEPEKVDLGQGVPSELERIIGKALNKSLDGRYSSASELRDDLIRLKEELTSRRFAAEYQIPRAAAEPTSAILAHKKMLAMMLVFLLLVAAGLFWNAHRQPVFNGTGKVILSDFSNSTGDPVFDNTLKQALRDQLEQSPFLNVLSEQKALKQLRFMGHSQDTKITSEIAREVCLRSEGQATVNGSISSLGHQFVLGLSAVNCQTGEIIASEQMEVESREKVLHALGQVTNKLRAHLGESLASIQKYDAPIEQATTTSLDALRAYSMGVRAGSADDQKGAIQYYEQAIELDPNFAMAYAGLGAASYNLNHASIASVATRRAYELRGTVSERERLSIEGQYYTLVTGEIEKAIQVYQLWQKTYPNDVPPHVNLGAFLNVLGRHEQALEEHVQALRLDPTNGMIWADLANGYANVGQIEMVQKTLQDAQAHKVTSPAFLGLRYQIAFLKGDQNGMDRELSASLGQPGTEAYMLSLQACTEAYLGRLSRAREFTRRAVESARRYGDEDSASSYLASQALWEAEFGNADRSRTLIVQARAKSSDQSVLTLAAVTAARIGDLNTAKSIAAYLGRQSPRDTLINAYWLPTIRASMQIASGNPGRAVDLLQATLPYDLATPKIATPLYSVYVRGIAYLALRQGPQAEAEFRKILDHPGIVGNYPLGALARLGIARADAIQAGLDAIHTSPEKLAHCKSTYQDFLNLWKDADIETPLLRAAQSEYRRLQ
jgi:serine/threonine protein kinase/Flp pilus assembly protein TadD